jgi:hypothetical protein
MIVIHLFSILLEAVIVLIALFIAVQRKKFYGFGFALTFAIYVLYDLANQFHLAIAQNLLILVFFVATVSALYSMWMLYRDMD